MPNKNYSANTGKEMRIICRLSNARTGTTEIYTEAVYTKIDGVWGYLCVDGLTVKFFWDSEGQIFCDHLTHFIVSYQIT